MVTTRTMPFRLGLFLCLLLIFSKAGTAEDTALRIGGEVISGPKDSASRDAWYKKMQAWREDAPKRIHDKDDQSRRAELLWTQRGFVQPQVMVEDRYFYDPVAGKYTV